MCVVAHVTRVIELDHTQKVYGAVQLIIYVRQVSPEVLFLFYIFESLGECRHAVLLLSFTNFEDSEIVQHIMNKNKCN